ncbi:Hpt domain-containing protein [Methylophaga lonarensis]|uniref:Hpt domain-containing protein n=1 Tax=Methylophaga lonarensis TaxID=999151 RepID=UPI003D2B9F29
MAEQAKGNYNALTWVQDELQKALEGALKAMESFIDSDRDYPQLNQVIDALQQVNGTLEMLNLAGAQKLGQEMQGLTVMLREQKLSDEQAAEDTLVRALLLLPNYLGMLSQQFPDHPLCLIDTINELRQQQQKTPLDESDLFKTRQSIPLPDLINPDPHRAAPDIGLEKSRIAHVFQVLLLSWLRDQEIVSLRKLRGITHFLRLSCQQEKTTLLWWAADALLEALAHKGLASAHEANVLLGRLAHPLRLMTEQDEQALLGQFPDELLDKLLLCVARSNSQGPKVSLLKQHFNLHFFDQQRKIYSMSDNALQDAHHALLDQLQELKGQIDEYQPHAETASEQLEFINSQIGQMADTLSLLSEDDTAGLLREHHQKLQSALLNEQELDAEELNALADALLNIEQKLHDKPGQSHVILLELQNKVLTESLIELSDIKEQITIASQQALESDLNQEIAHRIGKIAGSLDMLNQSEAQSLLQSTANTLMQIHRPLSEQEVEDLAEIFACMEIFMDGLRQHGQTESELVLQAQQILQNFGAERPAMEQNTTTLDDSSYQQSSELTYDSLEIDIEQQLPELPAGEADEESLSLDWLASASEDNNEENELLVITDDDDDFSELPEFSIDFETPSASDELTDFQIDLEQPNEAPTEPAVLSVDESETVLTVDTESVQIPPSQGFAGGIDPDIAEVFVEEADEVMADLQDLLPEWQAQESESDSAITEIRRRFHTLKGSGRMAGATEIGELAWAIEDLLNRVIEGGLPVTDAIRQCVTEAYQLLPELLLRFQQGETGAHDKAVSLAELAAELRQKSSLDTEQLEAAQDTVIDIDEQPQVSEQSFEAETIELELPETEQQALPVEDTLAAELDDEQAELQEIFRNEAREHLQQLQTDCQTLRPGHAINNSMLRSIHSLKGAANIAQAMPLALLCTQLDSSLRQLHRQQILISEQQTQQLQEILQSLTELLELDSSMAEAEDIRPLAAKIESLAPESEPVDAHVAIDPEVLVSFLEQTDELLDQYTEQLENWQQSADEVQKTALLSTLQNLSDSAISTGLPTLAALYQLLHQGIEQSHPDHPALAQLLDAGYEELNNQIESVIQNKPAPPIEKLDALLEQCLTTAIETEVEAESASELMPIEVAEAEDADLAATPPPEYPSEPAEPVRFEIPTDVDAELLSAFTEEAAELLNSCGEAIKQWQAEPQQTAACMQLQRDLHTLKGGARLTGISPLANLTHHMETLVLSASEGCRPTDTDFFELMFRCHDTLTEMQEQLARREAIDKALPLLDELTSPGADFIAIGQGRTLETVTAAATPDTSGKPSPAAATGEQVRVRAELLDYLSNFAGEVSIARDRVTQQHAALRQQLGEMEETVSRLHDQLRKLEIETETQILFRYEDELTEDNADFDPLELDRFSVIQQLSRSLTESVIDLNDISQSMDALVRETDSILLQQSRLNTDLQHGLMNTRLLPFTGIVPRLERIVRQTCTELGKQANLIVDGATLELDRTILDHLVAPLEHILRNAIAHGIESPEERLSAGKPEAGQLKLSLYREGSEVAIIVEDDGKGMNTDKIRQRALQMNLITTDQHLDENTLIQLILTSGFSTADNVSQLAGRGVGMDVVDNEIRNLKGRLDIRSERGKGTHFIMHLPLTLSLIRALLVSTNGQQYAIPLASVKAGERISRDQVQAMLGNKNAQYSYNGENYAFMPLSLLLGEPLRLPENTEHPMPLLLFRSGNTRLALLIDAINSNRDIVIKSVGPQLAHIRALNGATILGDGRVVFILDIPTLAATYRADQALIDKQPDAATIKTSATDKPLAMVVDDSITMRKASDNLLRRLGFDVITARDGVDALTALYERTPDVILLDIEMPRMDGFEFASMIRNDSRYRHLPVIMITSRTGDKHRQRAMNIGVNDYLGKPYQEEELIAVLQQQLASRYPHPSESH